MLDGEIAFVEEDVTPGGSDPKAEAPAQTARTTPADTPDKGEAPTDSAEEPAEVKASLAKEPAGEAS